MCWRENAPSLAWEKHCNCLTVFGAGAGEAENAVAAYATRRGASLAVTCVSSFSVDCVFLIFYHLKSLAKNIMLFKSTKMETLKNDVWRCTHAM